MVSKKRKPAMTHLFGSSVPDCPTCLQEIREQRFRAKRAAKRKAARQDALNEATYRKALKKKAKH